MPTIADPSTEKWIRSGSVDPPLRRTTKPAKSFRAHRPQTFWIKTGSRSIHSTSTLAFLRGKLGYWIKTDQYLDPAADQGLSLDVCNQNRTQFAGGNPITNEDEDGHYYASQSGAQYGSITNPNANGQRTMNLGHNTNKYRYGGVTSITYTKKWEPVQVWVAGVGNVTPSRAAYIRDKRENNRRNYVKSYAGKHHGCRIINDGLAFSCPKPKRKKRTAGSNTYEKSYGGVEIKYPKNCDTTCAAVIGRDGTFILSENDDLITDSPPNTGIEATCFGIENTKDAPGSGLCSAKDLIEFYSPSENVSRARDTFHQAARDLDCVAYRRNGGEIKYNYIPRQVTGSACWG